MAPAEQSEQDQKHEDQSCAPVTTITLTTAPRHREPPFRKRMWLPEHLATPLLVRSGGDVLAASAFPPPLESGLAEIGHGRAPAAWPANSGHQRPSKVHATLD